MAVFSNELRLDTSNFQTSLSKAASDSKTAAGEIEKALTIGVDVDTKGATASLNTFATETKGKISEIGGQLKEGLTGSFSNFGSAISGGIIGGGVVAGVQAAAGKIVEGFQFVIDKGSEFQTSLQGLSAITGVSGDALTAFGDKAKELAGKFGGDATTQLGSFQTILSKFGPQLADTPDALNAVTENVNILGKAAGLDAKQSVDALSNALLQFGVDASDPAKLAAESGRFINVLAEGAKQGAAEIPQVADAILQAGVAAKGANLSFEETNAAIQALAVGGKVGSEAGIGLRNVLGLLIKQSGPGAEALQGVGLSVEGLGKTLTTQGLQAALKELRGGIDKLGTDAEKAAFKATLFGTENAATAGILLDQVDAIGTLTKAVTGTSSATEQAQINMATFSEFMSRVKANLGNVAISIFDGFSKAFGIIAELTSGPVGEAFDQISTYAENMWSVVKPILMFIGGIIIAQIVNTINLAAAVLKVLYSIGNSVFEGIKNALAPLIDAFKKMFGIDGEVGKSIDVMQIFKDVLNTISSVLSAVGDVVSMVGGFVIEFLLTPFQLLVGIFATIVNKIREWIGVSKESNTETQKGAGFLDKLKTAFLNIKGTIGGVTQAFREIKTVIGEFFTALASFNISDALKAFTGFGERVKKAYDKGFNAVLDAEALKQEIKQREEAAAKAEEWAKQKESESAKTSAAKKDEISQYKLAKKALDIFIDAQKEARKEEELRLALLKKSNPKIDIQAELAKFDVKQLEARVAEAQKLLKIQLGPDGLPVDTSLKLLKDESKVKILSDFRDIQRDLGFATIKASAELNDPKIWYPKVKAALDTYQFFFKGSVIVDEKKSLKALALGASVLGFDFLRVTKEKLDVGALFENTGKQIAGAFQKLDWKKVFAKPQQASKEATDKIIDDVQKGTLSYQDAVDQLYQNIESVPSVFQQVRMQLNDIFTQITNDSISALAKAAEGAKTFSDVYDELAGVVGAAFGKVITEQKDAGTAILMVALDTLEALIPILAAQITALAFAQPASVATAGTAGAILAATLTAILYGLVGAAKASLQGFSEGGYTGDGGKYQTAGIVHRGEFVINKENTSKFRGILEQMNQGKMPVLATASFDAPQIQTEMSGMRQELSAIRARLDRMPDGIQGSMAVGVNVGFDTYLYERDRVRMQARNLRG